MAEISAKDVAALRKVTGAGMMDCKQALSATDGDIEQAKESAAVADDTTTTDTPAEATAGTTSEGTDNG